jgi:subtilisin family serine protease/sugar lactone lactonase YvrE
MKVESRSFAFFAALATALTLMAPAIAVEANLRPDGIDAVAGVIASPAANPYVETNGAQGAQRPGNVERASPHDPREPVRVVIELKDQPLMPYLQQLRAEQASAITSGARISAREQRSELAQAIDSQRSILEQAQTRLISDLRREGWIKQEHWRFTGLLNAVAITTRYEHLSAIYDDPRVLAVRFDTKVQALLETSVGVVGGPTVWGMLDGAGNTVTGQGITIAIIDTGIDYRHPDLGGCFGPGCKVIGGFDFVHGDEDPLDDNGHGTHVAGIAAANGGVRGVAPDAHLLAYKALDANGNGMDSDVIAALEGAVDPDGNPVTGDGADVINMSLGGVGGSDSPLSVATSRAMDAGSVVVVAAGNNGSGYETVDSPGNAENVLTVGAVNDSGQIANFSSRGPVSGNDYIKPEIVAPGVSIRSAAPGGSYATLSGTSMATPHVAGGAALLRQLHPTLSPQEIKALLVNNAHDVGEDVFTQGAGMMDLVAAATAQVIVTPALPSFGQVDLSQSNWQAQSLLTIRNISAQPWMGVFQQQPGLPSGISINPLPNSSVVLASGESAAVSLQLAVNNQTLPFSTKPTLHHESAFVLADGATSPRIPWALFKAAQLDLDIAGVPQHVLVFAETGCPANTLCSRQLQDLDCLAWKQQSKSPVHVRVKPGRYDVMVTYSDPPGSCTAAPREFVVKEGLDVASILATRIAPDDATHRIFVSDIRNENGQLIPSASLKAIASEIAFYNPGAGFIFSFDLGGVSGDTLFRLSDISGNFKVNMSALVANTGAPVEHPVHFVFSRRYDQGLLANQPLQLDGRNAGKVTFQYSDTEALTQGVEFWPTADALSFPSPFGTNPFINGSPLGPYSTPFKATTYAEHSTFLAGTKSPGFMVTRRGALSGPFNDSLLVETGPIGFADNSSYSKLDGVLSLGSRAIYTQAGHDLPVAQGPAYFAAYALYQKSSRTVVMLNSRLSQSGGPGLLKDLRHNLYTETLGYSIKCDGLLITQGQTRTVKSDPLGRLCNSVNIAYTMPTRLFGRHDTSDVAFTLNTQSPLPAGATAVEAPYLNELMLTSDGRPTRVLDGNDLRVGIKVSSDWARLGLNRTLDVSLQYRLNGTDPWLPLALTATGGGAYQAQLPVIAGANVGSLRLRIADQDGNSQEQTLNSLFLIGNNASSLTGAVPTIGRLPELRVSATGPLTAFTVPPVTANDSLDGTIAATADNKGPYPLGRNVIRWSAVNSSDVRGSATQTLNVVDVTPPQVSAPPNITRPAAGVYTAVDLGQASALDQEEGALVAVPHPSGPFGVGSHQVVWTAVDRAGNRGSSTQTVTITGDVSTPVLTIGDATVEEGDAGAVDLVFPITLSHPTNKPVAFDAGTSDLSANGNRDYVARQVFNRVIPAGASQTEFRVVITPDTDVEPSETFRVTLSNVVGAVADTLRATGTIVNDDVEADTIRTIAGTGTAAFTGDNGPAIQAAIAFPAAIALSRDGAILFADANNHRIRRIAVDGTIRTIAGNGSAGFSGDGGPAVAAALNFPTGVAIDGHGRIFVADTRNNRVRMIAPDGAISTIAGGGTAAFSGDGGPAVDALLQSPEGLAVDLSGNLYVADAGNARVRRIDVSGTITTIAGNGSLDSSGDGGPAFEAGLVPSAVAVDSADNVYVAESDSRRVRRIDSRGLIWPFLGDGHVGGSNGDGGPALSARLGVPVGVAVDAEGNVYVADASDNRVRKVTTDGIVSTVAGGGPGVGFAGDGGPAVDASLLNPRATAVDAAGNLFVADSNNQRIRRVGARRLTLDARDQFVWFVPPADDAQHQGFLRIRNPLAQPLTAQFWGIDEQGMRSPGTMVADLPANGSLQFNSLDLTFGNQAKGLSGRLGEGVGSWTLVTRSAQMLEPLSYIRTPDGFLTSMHDRVAGDGIDWWVPMFNPASNPNQVSHLRLVNTESDPVSLLIAGIDDSGQPSAGTVTTTLASLAALDLSASDLEFGNAEKGLAGQLGQGTGKWQLRLSATGRIVAQSQLVDPNGNITNLSTIADDVDHAPGQRTLWFVPAAFDAQHQGFVRLINREARSGQVRVWGIDDTGTTSPGAITLTLAANESRQFNSQDAVFGNASKGLDGSLGVGTGDWRLVIASDLDLQAMAFIRTPDGFLTSMHDVGSVDGTSLQIPIFNPAQNPNQVSWLRLINPNGFAVTAMIDGVDDGGVRASGHVSLTLPAHATIEISATDLEAGNPALGLAGSLGDGEGKWALEVTTSAPIKAISLLRDPRGFVTNLSRGAQPSSRLDP